MKAGTIPYDNIDEYNKAKDNMVAKDEAHHFDSDITLSDDEKALDRYLTMLKSALRSGYRQNNFYPPARYFYKSKDTIENNPLYTLLRDMPKGGIMHIHTSSTCDPGWVVDQAQVNSNCYVYWQEDPSKGKLHFYNSDNVPDGYVLASTVPRDDIYSLLTFNVDDNDDGMDIWEEFGKCFSRISGFVCYEPVFQQYYTHAFETIIDDEVQYVELRAGLGDGLYDLNGTDYPAQDMVDRLKNAMITAQQKNPNFAVKLIYSGHRSEGLGGVYEELERAFDLVKDNPGFVVGFDLVGEEDLTYNPYTEYRDGQLYKKGNTKGNTTYYFIKDMMRVNQLERQYNVKMPLFYHDGESDWIEDKNLYDAVLLDCLRIGHGFNAFRFPEVKNAVIEKDINIEVCPLSNQILGYIRDLRIHPASGYLNSGMECTISPDDPGIFGYDGVTPDFWEVVMGWDIGIADLKKLIINSFKYSQMQGTIDDSASEKGKAFQIWQSSWNSYVTSANNTLSSQIKFVSVDSKQKWQDTGVLVSQGQTCWIIYESGLWTANPSTGMVNARGNEDIIAKKDYTCQYANEGALIAKINDTTYLSGLISNAPDGAIGNVELCINDDLNGEYGAGFSDNEGSITVGIIILDASLLIR